eukprot:jgi/Chlat1/7988/Chrsp7S07745
MAAATVYLGVVGVVGGSETVVSHPRQQQAACSSAAATGASSPQLGLVLRGGRRRRHGSHAGERLSTRAGAAAPAGSTTTERSKDGDASSNGLSRRRPTQEQDTVHAPRAAVDFADETYSQQVPEGHKELHGFLYGDGGAEVHGDASSTSVYVPRDGEDDGAVVVELEQWASVRELAKPAGVYAIYDEADTLQYVGYSRSMAVAVRAHRARAGPHKAAKVRARVVRDPAMITRTRLEAVRDEWMTDEFGHVPLGNGSEKELWEGVGSLAAVMTDAERAAYEEKKLKMRKAMGENLYDDVEGEAEDSKQRRLNLLRAVEGDDWSGVIDGQTKETVAIPSRTPIPSPAPVEQIVSPFARANAPSVGSTALPMLELTPANVDKVLDEVRPYLIADGGNVEVAGVHDGVVALRLQGACGTCPSSTATMKMGLEKSLRAHFGDILKEVVQVDKTDITATVQKVDAHLDMLRPAITNYGGSVEVVSVDAAAGTCEVRYSGPPPIGMGVQAAIKDKFPDIRQVTLLQ